MALYDDDDFEYRIELLKQLADNGEDIENLIAQDLDKEELWEKLDRLGEL